MPTIKQLPAATSVGASDELPLSQGGTTKSLAVGDLLSSTQTALTLISGKLLGRVSSTAGGPEPVGVGTGLGLAAGVIGATGADHVGLAVSTALADGDEVVVNSQGAAKRMAATLLRGLFSAGRGVSIGSDGTISALSTGGTALPATASLIGSVKPGAGLSVAGDGTLSGDGATFEVVAAGGSLARTVSVRAGDVASVLDQAGADRTGVADSAAAFDAAAAQGVAANVSVAVPPGDYRLDSVVVPGADQSWELTGTRFTAGSAPITDAIDWSPFYNRVAKAWLRNSNEQGTAFSTITTMNIGVTGATISYEKAAGYDYVQTADPSTYTGGGTAWGDLVDKDAVGRVINAQIAPGNLTGRTVCLNLQAQVPVGADGIASGFEVDNVNHGRAEPYLSQPTTKVGGSFVALGSSPSTVATLISRQGTAQYFNGHVVQAEAVMGSAFGVLETGTLDQYSFSVSTSGEVSAQGLTIAGSSSAPTAAAGTNTTQLATTAFVQTAVAGLGEVATTGAVGVVKPDGTTMVVAGDGTLSVEGVLPAAAGSVPSLSNLQLLMPDGTTITGAQLLAAMGGTAPSSGGTGPGVETLTVGTITAPSVNTAFTVSGTYANGTPAGLDVSVDGGTTWVAAASPVISGGAYSFSVAGLAAGTYVVRVRDHAATGVVASSNGFTVAAAQQAPANAYVVGWYGSGPGATFAPPNQYAGYSYGVPSGGSGGFFKLTPSGGGADVANSTAALCAWHTSATVPPGAASLPPGFAGSNLANGFQAATAAGTAPYFYDTGRVAKPTGSGATTYYFWASIDGGATWSVYRNGSNVAIGVLVTF